MTKVPNELQIVVSESKLPDTKIEVLLQNFAPVVEKARELSIKAQSIIVTNEDERMKMQEARNLRLELKKMRTATDATRKVLKEESLREGKAIDGLANVIKAIIEPAESHLQLQEDFAKIAEENRKLEIMSKRVERLSEFESNDPSMYNLKDMNDESFEQIYQQAKAIDDARKQAIIAAELKAKEAENAEKKRVEEVEKENLRLKTEAIKKEKIAREVAIEQERIKKAQDKLLEEAQEKMDKLQAEAQKLEAEKKAQEEAAIKVKIIEEESIKTAANAPDKQKLLGWSNMLQIACNEAPLLQTEKATAIKNKTQEYITRVIKNLQNEANQI